MAHTFAGSIFSLSFNGIEVGEIGADAALCGHYSVPVGLVAGDQAACEEARALLGEAVCTVAVKEGLGRNVARCLPLPIVYQRIEEQAAVAVRQADRCAPFVFQGPVVVQVIFTDPTYADTVANLDFVTRVDGRTIRFEGADYLKAFERFNALHFLAGAVR